MGIQRVICAAGDIHGAAERPGTADFSTLGRYQYGDRLSAASDVDIVLTHDAPAGVHFPRHRGGRGFVSRAAGLDEMLRQRLPSVCFFGHHHTRLDADIRGVRCVGPNKVAQPGNLVAIEMAPGRRDRRFLGEWARGQAEATPCGKSSR